MSELNKPILPGAAATDYERYLRTDELLALQKGPGDVVHHDEHLFQAVHQTSELWLKLACTELGLATSLAVADNAAGAGRHVRRANDSLALVTAQLPMLEHMNPVDYAVVRTALGHGAGFDSPGFRRVLKVSPPLGDAFTALIQRRGVTLYDLYHASLDREDLYQLAEAMIT